MAELNAEVRVSAGVGDQYLSVPPCGCKEESAAKAEHCNLCDRMVENYKRIRIEAMNRPYIICDRCTTTIRCTAMTRIGQEGPALPWANPSAIHDDPIAEKDHADTT